LRPGAIILLLSEPNGVINRGAMENATQTPIFEQPDFRMYAAQWADAGHGSEVLMQLCEDLDPASGRWEPFYAILERRPKQAQFIN